MYQDISIECRASLFSSSPAANIGGGGGVNPPAIEGKPEGMGGNPVGIEGKP